MIVYDVAAKELDRESFPQHKIAGLVSGIKFIVLFSQEKPLWWKEINTHKHMHTHECINCAIMQEHTLSLIRLSGKNLLFLAYRYKSIWKILLSLKFSFS